MNLQLSSEHIKAEAKRLGFSACGIAQALPVDSDVALRFNTWLEQGGHAEMSYMARNVEKRLNPLLLMPEVKSIVSVALNYTPARRISPGEPQIAAYALGHDYHDVVKNKLHALAAALGITAYRAFCDTAPVLERYWAVKAGIGWIGNNHQLYVKGAGSMCFLGELFLTIPLAADRPLPHAGCGSCRACIDRCPAHALDKDTFHASRCLSYLTIEHRGPLPPQAAQWMHATPGTPLFYGCDRCTEVCPYNAPKRTATDNDGNGLRAGGDGTMPANDDFWKHLTLADYRHIFRGSAVKRAKYEGLMRNIRAFYGEESAENDAPDSL